MNCFSTRNLQNQLVLIHGIPIYKKNGIAFFMMVNSVIQLDLLFKRFKIKLCDISPFSSKILVTSIKSLFIQLIASQ
jgi:hypothetical protein